MGNTLCTLKEPAHKFTRDPAQTFLSAGTFPWLCIGLKYNYHLPPLVQSPGMTPRLPLYVTNPLKDWPLCFGWALGERSGRGHKEAIKKGRLWRAFLGRVSSAPKVTRDDSHSAGPKHLGEMRRQWQARRRCLSDGMVVPSRPAKSPGELLPSRPMPLLWKSWLGRSSVYNPLAGNSLGQLWKWIGTLFFHRLQLSTCRTKRLLEAAKTAFKAI